MDKTEILKYANIKHDGSILLGNHTVCDGSHFGRKIGIFSHIHRDHTNLFNQAMHECSQIFVSPATLDLLAVLDQDYDHNVSAETYFKGRHIHPLDFKTPKIPILDEFSLDKTFGDKITLIKANHILGSAQVVVETSDNVKIVYSGDFTSGTDPIPCKILVLDSTHGDPMFNTVIERKSLENRLVECVENEITSGKSILIRAHRGRLQYTMHLLSERLPNDIKFLTHPNDLKLIPVYRKYGLKIRDSIDFKSPQGEGEESKDYPYIEFRAHGQGKNMLEESDKMTVFELGGKILGGGNVLRQKMDGNYDLEFGDHADYKTIIDYVKGANPEAVVTDYSRGKQGEKLAERLSSEGFTAIPLPVLDKS